MADYEDVQESEASDIHVKSFKNQETFVKEDYEFPCAHGSLRLPRPSRLSSTAEGNLEPEDVVEIAERDKKGKQK